MEQVPYHPRHFSCFAGQIRSSIFEPLPRPVEKTFLLLLKHSQPSSRRLYHGCKSFLAARRLILPLLPLPPSTSLVRRNNPNRCESPSLGTSLDIASLGPSSQPSSSSSSSSSSGYILSGRPSQNLDFQECRGGGLFCPPPLRPEREGLGCCCCDFPSLCFSACSFLCVSSALSMS